MLLPPLFPHGVWKPRKFKFLEKDFAITFKGNQTQETDLPL